ncbi:hypothetical protein OESDEN_18676 [Oesophagostomum dentatum]|uniref:Uncharacterized protein n=1 Tax=Oesophagostomum dentatum TaxID=61180 RepID=A0A0B1SCQ0_OESDE|nr:hypothetical protein OESDEN_18676 [Oesophagostomum dentatum]
MRATTGMCIIVALFSIVILLIMCKVIGGLAASPELDTYELATVVIRFAVSAGIALTTLAALHTERAALLIPYFLIQVSGFVAGLALFVSFLFIFLLGNRSTAVSFLRFHGYSTVSSDELVIACWVTIILSAIIMLLHTWLLGIGTACWRDKRAFGESLEESRPLSKVGIVLLLYS